MSTTNVSRDALDSKRGQDIDVESLSSVSDNASREVKLQVQEEEGHEIKFRSCSWQKTAALLFSEYICLAILSFPWSFSVLGMVPGVILTIGVAAIVQYNSLILWRYCMKHPEIRDVCDIGRDLFGGSQWAYNATAVLFIGNNTFIMALHCLVGAKWLNTISDGATCTIVFSVVAAIGCWFVSLPRTLSQLSWIGTFSAATMGISVLLAIIFSDIQDHSNEYTIELGNSLVTAIPVHGTPFISGMSAALNIVYTFVGQITLPSFIAEMKEPKDFPKALWAVTICEVVVFTLCGAVMYHFVGNQYMTAPAFGSLIEPYKKIAFSFALPTILFLGALYASVSARFIFFRLFRNSKHRHTNTVFGWAVWSAILAALWALAFILAEVIPFFSDLLSLMSSLFDCWFGFIFWGMAYLTLYPPAKRWISIRRSTETAFNYLLIVIGAYILVAGTYSTVQSIIDNYKADAYGKPFICVSNAL